MILKIYNKKGFVIYPIVMIVSLVIISLIIISNVSKIDNNQKNISEYIDGNEFNPNNTEGIYVLKPISELFNPVNKNISKEIIDKYFKITKSGSKYFPFLIADDLYFINKELNIYDENFNKIDKEKSIAIINDFMKVLDVYYEDDNYYENLKDYLSQEMFFFNNYEELYNSNFNYNNGFINFQDNSGNYYNYIYDIYRYNLGFVDDNIIYYSYEKYFTNNDYNNNNDNNFILVKNILNYNKNLEFSLFSYPIIIEDSMFEFYNDLIENDISYDKILLGSKEFYNDLNDSYYYNINKYNSNIFDYLDYYLSYEINEEKYLEDFAIYHNSLDKSDYEEEKINIINYENLNKIYGSYYFNFLSNIEFNNDILNVDISENYENIEINKNLKNYIENLIIDNFVNCNSENEEYDFCYDYVYNDNNEKFIMKNKNGRQISLIGIYNNLLKNENSKDKMIFLKKIYESE